MTKKWIVLVLALALCLGIAACGDSNATNEVHKIGVIVYNLADEEVVGFREYLQGYMQKTFEIVEFVYSGSIRTQEEEMAFIQDACDQGVEGFLSFRTFDLKAEVELCEKNSAYYLLASGTVSDEEFDTVADNPWFLGMFGPGIELEYQAGLYMAKFFAREHGAKTFFLLSGGAGSGNEMHYQRTLGMLNGLSTLSGVTFGKPAEELAASETTVTVSTGPYTVTIVPGYMSQDESRAKAINVYSSGTFDAVLAALNIGDFSAAIRGSELGMVDSYNARCSQMFTAGKLHYLVGKYSSCVGPAFALMLNAVTGYAGDFRSEGRAVKIAQSFWTSENADDFNEKYALSQSQTMNAYNFGDLSSVCRVFNKDADLVHLIALAQANSYEAVLVRRAA